MKREKVQQTKSQQRRIELQQETAKADTKEGLKKDLDALLDEVDSVLEVNAEEFVNAYVQKGGE